MLWLNGNELGFGLRGLGSGPPQVGVLCFLDKYFPFSASLHPGTGDSKLG